MKNDTASLAGVRKPHTAAPNGPRRMTLNMGPQHPSTHGVLRVVLELDGETIIEGRARHRLPAHRHRERVRGQNLAAGGYAHRPRRLPREPVEQSRAMPWPWRSCCSWKFRPWRSGCA